jgi:hypothetical protein
VKRFENLPPGRYTVVAGWLGTVHGEPDRAGGRSRPVGHHEAARRSRAVSPALTRAARIDEAPEAFGNARSATRSAGPRAGTCPRRSRRPPLSILGPATPGCGSASRGEPTPGCAPWSSPSTPPGPRPKSSRPGKCVPGAFRGLTHGCRSNPQPQRKFSDRRDWVEALVPLGHMLDRDPGF